MGMASASGGILLGSGAGTVLFSIFTKDQILDWAWRLPFLASIPMGLSIAVLRSSLPQEENHETHTSSHPRRSSVLHVLLEHPWALIRGAFGGWASQAGFYTLAIFMSSYLTTGKIFTEPVALGLQTTALCAAICIAPLSGFLSDKFGRKPIALTSLVGMMLCAYPLYAVVNLGNNTLALIALVGFMVFVAFGGVSYQIWLAEVFPRTLRATGLGIAYNIAAGILGGTTPILCVTLIEMTKNRMAPAALLIVASVVSMIFLLLQRETGNRPLK